MTEDIVYHVVTRGGRQDKFPDGHTSAASAEAHARFLIEHFRHDWVEIEEVRTVRKKVLSLGVKPQAADTQASP